MEAEWPLRDQCEHVLVNRRTADPVAQYARRPDGTRVTPVAPYFDGFDPATAPWRDLGTGEPLTIRLARAELSPRDITARKGAILVETIGRIFDRNHRRHDPTMRTRDGRPCTATTVGLIEPAPTEAYRLELISKEPRNLDRAGITEDPAWSAARRW